MRSVSTLLLSSCLCATGAVAGQADVRFVNAPGFSDAGNHTSDEKANLDLLARHLQDLAQRWLPAGQTLTVEVLDVDLAGTVQDARRGSSLTRVVRGGADFPRIQLRYSLAQDGQVVRSGEERLADLDYARGLSGGYRASQPLHYEKRLLASWFKERLVEGRIAARG